MELLVAGIGALCMVLAALYSEVTRIIFKECVIHPVQESTIRVEMNEMNKKEHITVERVV
jgi:hypothetical protein